MLLSNIQYKLNSLLLCIDAELLLIGAQPTTGLLF